MGRTPIDFAALNPIFTKKIDRKNTNSIKFDFYEDKDIIPLWLADMDFLSPEPIRNELSKLALENIYGYTKASDQATQAVINWVQEQHNWAIKPEWVVWLPGLVPGLNMASRCIGKDGDKNLVFTPIYPPFTKAPKLSRRKKVTQDFNITNDDWSIDNDAMNQNLKESALLLFCNPHNPVGKMFNQSELEKIADACLKNDVYICSDEIHCDIVLSETKKHIPIATLNPEIAEKCITLGSPSKVFNLAGIGCSYAIISNTELREKFKKAGEGIVPYPNLFGYKATEIAYTKGHSWLKDLTLLLKYNLALLEDFVKKNKKIKMVSPDATYLAWLEVSSLQTENASKLFESFGVGLSPGHWFSNNNYVRLNFACAPELLEEALTRMQKAIDSQP